MPCPNRGGENPRVYYVIEVIQCPALSGYPLFDLVVIDEASQCDIASVVPLLARGRRAVLAGDPMQQPDGMGPS